MRIRAESRSRPQGAPGRVGTGGTPSRFRIGLADAAAQLDAAAWRSVAGADRPYLEPSYLAALEASGPPGVRFRYLTIREGRRPVAVATVQCLEPTGAALGRRPATEGTGRVRRGLRWATGTLAARIHLRLRLCGNVFAGCSHGFALARDADRPAIADALVGALERVRASERRRGGVDAVMIDEATGADDVAGAAPMRDALVRHGYRPIATDPAMVVRLDPAWRSLPDYFAAMNAKYRSRAQAVRAKGEALQRRLLDSAAIEARGDDLHALLQAMADRARVRPLAHPRGHLPELKRRLGDALQVTGYELDGRLVGFGSFITRGDELDAHFGGLDYAQNTPHALYANILWDHVRAGLERGVRRVWLGRTASGFKSGMGAVPVAARLWVRHAGPLGRRVLRWLAPFAEPAPWTPRNPFRDAVEP